MQIKTIHDLLYDWAEWHCRMLEKSGLGFGDTITGKMQRGDIVRSGKPGALVPRLDVPYHLKDVDRAMRTIPRHCKLAVLFKFGWQSGWKQPMTDADRFNEWKKKSRKTSRDTYHRHLSNAIYYVAGKMDKRA